VGGVIGVCTSQYFSAYKDVSNLWSNNFSQKPVQHKPSSLVSRVAAFFWDTLFVSIFASLFIFPIVVFYFKEATLSSLVSNPLVLWLVPYVMGIGILRVCLLWFFDLFHYVGGVPLFFDLLLDLPLSLMTFLLHFVSGMPTFIFSAEKVTLLELCIYYIILLSVLIYLHRARKGNYVFSF
jgi:hypothetical protein